MDDQHELAQIHSPRKKLKDKKHTERFQEGQRSELREESLEEGEVCNRDNTQHKLHEAAPGVSVSKTYIERTLKRKSELNIMEKSAEIERRAKRSKDAAEMSGQQRRCRGKDANDREA